MSDYTRTPNLNLYKPTYDADEGAWGGHLNWNADTLDALLATSGGTFLPIAGGAMTGTLLLAADPTAPLGAASKQMVDGVSGQLGNYLPIAGGTMTAPAASAVPILTLNTSNNGVTCNNGLEVVQGYNGGNLAMDHGLTPHTASVRYGTETFHDHFGIVFNTTNRATGQYNNLESVLTIPASPASCNLTNAFTASVHDYGGRGALAATLYAMAGVNNATIYALNTVCTDRNGTNPYPTPLTNVREQIELDYFVSDPSTTVRGVLNVLSAATGSGPVTPATAVSWLAYSISLFPGSAPWNVAYHSGNGSANTALLVGSSVAGNPASTGNTSQPIIFNYTDNTTPTTQHAVNMLADPTLAGSIGTDFRITGDAIAPLAARVNVTIDNLAAFKSLNAAKTAALNVAIFDGQNRLNLGDLTAGNIYLARQTLAASATGPFPCVPNMVGPPTGNADSGALVLDTANGRLCTSLGGGNWAYAQVFVRQSSAGIVSAAVTGEQVLVSIALPVLSANASVRITTVWTYPNSANTKTLLVKHGASAGTVGTLLQNITVTTTVSAQNVVFLRNAGSQSSQKAMAANAFGSNAASASGLVTGAINTAVVSYVNITCGTNGTELVTLESYTVEILVP